MGVGAVIWAKRRYVSGHEFRPIYDQYCGRHSFDPSSLWRQADSDGTGRLYLVGCGFNAYPRGSACDEFPQMDYKQLDRQWRKYRYIVHAEQNAITFR